MGPSFFDHQRAALTNMVQRSPGCQPHTVQDGRTRAFKRWEAARSVLRPDISVSVNGIKTPSPLSAKAGSGACNQRGPWFGSASAVADLKKEAHVRGPQEGV